MERAGVGRGYHDWTSGIPEELLMSVSRRLRALAAFAAALPPFLGAPGSLEAQSATLEGFVLGSSSGRRLPGVLVAAEGGPRTRSGDEGVYRLEGIEPGERRIALVAPGCQITMATVDLWPGETRSLAFEILYDPKVADQLARRRRSSGKVVTGWEIEAMHAPTLLDVLSRVAPGMVGSQPRQPGMDPVARSRSPVGFLGNVPPAVILDGSLLGATGFSYIQDISPTDVAWLEILGGASGGWEVGTGGSGGLVRIQTKRGRQMDAPILDPEQCEIPGWKGV